MSASINDECNKKHCHNTDFDDCYCADCFNTLEEQLYEANQTIKELEAEIKKLNEFPNE